MQLYLCSEGSVAASAVHNKHLAPQGVGKSLLYITTANELRGIEPWDQDTQAVWEELGYEVMRWTVTDKSPEEIKQALDDCDLIYVNGGYTPYLLSQLRKTGGDRLLIDAITAGNPYVGSSAGSIVLGPTLEHLMEMYDRAGFVIDGAPVDTGDGLGIVPFVIFPHWGRGYFKTYYLGEGFGDVYDRTKQPILLLQDTQYVVVTEHGYNIERVSILP